MRRRADRGLTSLLWPMLAFIAFGMARVVAPVSLIGLLFDHPWVFAAVSFAVVLAGAALLFVRPIETRVASLLVPSRLPTAAEEARMRGAFEAIGERAGMRTDGLIPRVQDASEMNASAGAANMVFVTEGALRRDEAEFEALIAHELGHHRGLHPIGTTMVWWLSLPGEALAAVYRALRRLALRLTHRARPVAVVVQLVLVVWQFSVMWMHYLAELLALRAARLSEYAADRAAADWGYGDALARLLSTVPDDDDPGRLARLRATHPPTARRIERLAAR